MVISISEQFTLVNIFTSCLKIPDFLLALSPSREQGKHSSPSRLHLSFSVPSPLSHDNSVPHSIVRSPSPQYVMQFRAACWEPKLTIWLIYTSKHKSYTYVLAFFYMQSLNRIKIMSNWTIHAIKRRMAAHTIASWCARSASSAIFCSASFWRWICIKEDIADRSSVHFSGTSI